MDGWETETDVYKKEDVEITHLSTRIRMKWIELQISSLYNFDKQSILTIMCAKKDNSYRSQSSSEEDSPYSIKNSKVKNKKSKIQKPVSKKQHKKAGKPTRGGPGSRKRSRNTGINHLSLNNKDELVKKLQSKIKKQFLEYINSIGFKRGLVMKPNQRLTLKKEQEAQKSKAQRNIPRDIPEIEWDADHEWIRTEQFEKLTNIFKKFEIKYSDLLFNLENYENFFLNISSLYAREQTSEIYHILMQLYAIVMHFPEGFNSNMSEEQITLIKNFSTYLLEMDPMKDMSMEQEFGFLENMTKFQSFMNYPYCFFNKKFTKERKKLKIDESQIKKEKLERLFVNTARGIKILELLNKKGNEEVIKLEFVNIFSGQKAEKNENENADNEVKSQSAKMDNISHEEVRNLHSQAKNQVAEVQVGNHQNQIKEQIFSNIEIQKEDNVKEKGPHSAIEIQNSNPAIQVHLNSPKIRQAKNQNSPQIIRKVNHVSPKIADPIPQQGIDLQTNIFQSIPIAPVQHPPQAQKIHVSGLTPRKNRPSASRKTYSYKFRVIGMMSGTSLDGMDLSYCQYYKYLQPQKQKWKYRLITAKTYEYSAEITEILNKMTNPAISHLQFLECQRIYSHEIVQKIKIFIQTQINKKDSQKNQVIDFVCLHGHTIFHQPSKNYTIQAANLNLIAAQLQTDVIGNFRQLDVHRGGHGAPLAPYGQQLFENWASNTQEQISRQPQDTSREKQTIYLNLGGIANIGLSVRQGSHKQIFGTDIAFCNIVLNHISGLLNNESFDKFGQFGRVGKFNKEYYTKLMSFFPTQPFPISLGKQQIDVLLHQITLMFEHSTRDEVLSFTRTYYEFLADKITECIYEWGLIKLEDPYGTFVRILSTGGGTYNTFLIELITLRIQTSNRCLKAHVEFQIPSKQIIQFKQSIVFGLLGVKCYLGEPNCERGIGGMLVKGGKSDGIYQNERGEKKEACFNENVKIFSIEVPQVVEEPVYPKIDTTIEECYRVIRFEDEENKNLSVCEQNGNSKRYFIDVDLSQWH